MSYNLKIVKNYEGFRSHAYPDPLSGGKPWTIGYGSTHHSDGTAIKPGDVVTEQQADKLLNIYVQDRILPALQRIPHWQDMSPNMQVALIDFAYNLGATFYGSPDFHTISEDLKNHDWSHVPAALVLYCNPGSSCHAGLLKRRNEEADLWTAGLHGLIAARKKS